MEGPLSLVWPYNLLSNARIAVQSPFSYMKLPTSSDPSLLLLVMAFLEPASRADAFDPCSTSRGENATCTIRRCEYHTYPRTCAIRQSKSGNDVAISMYIDLEQKRGPDSLRLSKRKDNFFEEEGGQIWRRQQEGRFEVFSSLNFFGEVGHELILWPE